MPADFLASPATFAALLVALLAAGAVSGLLAGLFGVGGGAVLVPVLYECLGYLDVDESIRMHLSVATSAAATTWSNPSGRAAAGIELASSGRIPTTVPGAGSAPGGSVSSKPPKASTRLRA